MFSMPPVTTIRASPMPIVRAAMMVVMTLEPQTLFTVVAPTEVGMPAPARQASIGAGIPTSVGATTVNKVCGSSVMTTIMAARTIGMGEARIVVTGGMENMTRAPYLLEKARQGYRLGHGELTDSLVKDGLWDVYNNFHMGNAGELCAKKYKFTRQELDDFALESYRRAREAIASGAFKREIVGVEVPQKRGPPLMVTQDEEPDRVGLSKMRPPKPG